MTTYPATWSTGVWTGTPDFLPTAVVNLATDTAAISKREAESSIIKKDILVPASLIPTSTVNPATWSTGVWTGTPKFLPTSIVNLATDTGIVKRAPEITSFPDLVPSTTVDLATDGTGIFTGTPKFMPTSVVQLEADCSVSLSTEVKKGTTEWLYFTHCSDGATPTGVNEMSALITGVSGCCGGEDDFYACGSDGAMPTGPARWTCTFEGFTYAGVTAATTSWS